MANANLDFSGLTVTRTYTFPDATGTIALDTGSANITTVGTITVGTWHGTKIGLAYGGTNADLSATGGAHNFLKQSSGGATITVGQPALADLSDAATIALLASPTFTGTPAAPNPTGGDDSTQLATTHFVFTGGVYSASNVVTATTGGSTHIGTNIATSQNVLFIASGTLATYEIIADDGTYDGQILFLSFNHIITALTYTGANWGTAGFAVPTAATANSCQAWVWDATNKWVRFQ